MDFELIIVDISQYNYCQKDVEKLLPKCENDILAYREEKDKVRAFASELLKRYWLPKILDINRDDLVIRKNGSGKPYLEGEFGQYSFNISHSGAYVIMAIAQEYEVGVDIEKIENSLSYEELCPIVFSQQEQVYALKSLNTFYTMWTKKEAFLKALGVGFLDPSVLNKTDLNLDPYQILEEFNCEVYSERIFTNYILSFSIHRRKG